jgi:hypothetical protein
METPKNIQETTITVGDIRINISAAGLWMDNLDNAGNVQLSTALAWEELSAEEYELYSAMVQVEECDLQALRKV